jgi:hypothetical protein
LDVHSFKNSYFSSFDDFSFECAYIHSLIYALEDGINIVGLYICSCLGI